MQTKTIRNGLIFVSLDAISEAREQKLRVPDQKRMRKSLRILSEEAKEIQEMRDEKRDELEGDELNAALQALAAGTTEVQLPNISTAILSDLRLKGDHIDLLEILFGKDLEDDFPKREELKSAGLDTYEAVRDYFGDLEDIDGIGSSSAEEINSRISEFEAQQQREQRVFQSR